MPHDNADSKKCNYNLLHKATVKIKQGQLSLVELHSSGSASGKSESQNFKSLLALKLKLHYGMPRMP